MTRIAIVLLAALALTTGAWAASLGAPDRQTFVPLTAPSAPIQYGQVFQPLPSTAPLVGTRGMLWSTANRTDTPVPGVYTLRYTLAYRIYFNPVGNIDTLLGWLYTNHPDWIEYLADRTTPAYEFSDTQFPPVDISNPAVVSFLASEAVRLGTGYQGIGLDNADPQNDYLQAGHYTATTAPCLTADRPACHGTWVTQYNGSSDPAWYVNNLTYFATLRKILAVQGYTLFLNLSYGGGIVGNHVSDNLAANGSMAEGWPQNVCGTFANVELNGFVIDAYWQNNYASIISDSLGWWFAASYLCGHDTGSITQQEESWASANYLLVSQNPGQNYLSDQLVGANTYVTYPASMNPPIGSAAVAPPSPGTCGGTGVGTDLGICTRLYSNGLVAVNSSGENTRSFTLGAGNWVDQFCTPVSAGSVSLAPATAIVIVAHPNSQCP